jgi:hypothetical protein
MGRPFDISLLEFKISIFKMTVLTLPYNKVIYSVKHNIYIIINTQLATCFGFSEPSSGEFLIDMVHSVCAHIMGFHIVYKPFGFKIEVKIFSQKSIEFLT